MLYQLHITTAEGRRCTLATKFASIELAMTTGCIALRHGATDAYVEDESGKKVADAHAIKAHARPPSSHRGEGIDHHRST